MALRKWWMGLAASLGLGGGAAYTYGRFIEPENIEVTEHDVLLPHLDAEFHGYRIAQISDIHFDSYMTRARLEKIVEKVNAQHPDLIVFTGDFITHHIRYVIEDLTEALRGLHAPDGVLAVPGNHDHKKALEIVKLRQMMRDLGIHDLSNTVCTIRRENAALHIAGVDSMIARRARLDLALAALPSNGAAILLAHEPDFADISQATHRFDLQLSGHTHGGQIRPPLLGAVSAVLPRYGRLYVMGMVKVDDLLVYINRGLGTVSVPLRINCRPEISVFTLQSPFYDAGKQYSNALGWHHESPKT
ncbi:MAG: metallophosphoesterase [bacterium]|nr:metallophosphoesterase [bacterium]